MHTIKEHHIDSEQSLKSHLMLPHDVDLLIRTGGEVRLSNFLLVQLAYAELLFLKTPWPAFNVKTLRHTLKIYQKRIRKFGGLL